jgi:hypothetical protein
LIQAARRIHRYFDFKTGKKAGLQMRMSAEAKAGLQHSIRLGAIPQTILANEENRWCHQHLTILAHCAFDY